MPKNSPIPPTSDKVREILIHEELHTPAEAGTAKDRSADATPTIQNSDDLERVTSDAKPTAGLSQEAKQQIAAKLQKKRAA